MSGYQTISLASLPVIESESCPKGTLFLIPNVLKVRILGETQDQWATRIMEAAKRGEIVAITGLGPEER